MPEIKAYFSMTFWNRQDQIITLGGYFRKYVKSAHQYSTANNKWTALPDLPDKLDCSAATVLNDVLYNFGGENALHSVYHLDLLS